MVSRYGVTKEGAVGVTVGVGAMHCLLPHCGGPHHLSPHGHNPNHNHIHHHNHHNHHNHHPPASQSPHGHLSQLNHAQHQLTININHNHQLQSQQTQHQQQPPPQYRIITASARSDVNFHVPGQNYGGQPGGQVGGGGGSVGVPGGRGPPQIGGIQTIGQSAPGIPQGSQTGAQQPPPQSQTPGVQSQQPQGPPPTTTPPGHTQSPQEMGKQPHLQAQPLPLQPNLYATSQPRPASQVYYSSATRPQAARGNHRGGQGGGGAQVVSIPSVGGGGGQQTAMFPHPASLPMAPGTLYMQSQVPLHPSHSGTHQPPVYSMNNPMQPVQFPGPPQRPQGHQSQQFFQTYPPTIIQSNLFGYSSPSPHHAFYYPQQGPQVNLGRPTAGAISGGAPHVGSPLPGGQGANVVQQGSIQQPSQQPQQMQPMALPLVQTDVYQGHNGGVQNPGNSAAARKKQRRKKAILDIVDPKTGKNISEQIYDDDAATQSGDSSNRATPQPQNCGMEMIADFAARVAKAANDESDSGSPAPSSAPETPTSQNTPPILPNLVQPNPEIDNNSQCNTGPPTPTQSIPNVPTPSSQSLVSSNTTVQIDLCPVKPKEHKPLQLPVREFQPRNEIKILPEEPQPIPVVINQEIISSQLPVPVPIPEPEPPVAFVPPPSIPEASNISATVQSSSIIATEAVSNTATAPNSNSVPSKEEFPTLDPKISTNSPARRKSHNQGHSQTVAHPVSEASPPVPKEQKERKLSERNLNSRGTTPTPVQNQSDHHHPKPNGDTISEKLDKHDPEPVSKTDQQQQQPRLVDGKATQKQKNKRSHLKNRDLINRKGAEKEGTEMDAFMTTAPSAKPEAKQSEVAKQETQESLLPNDSGKESAKDIKDEENIESKKGAESKLALKIEQAAPEASKENTPVQTPTTEKLPSIVQNNKESSKETTPTIEDTGRIEEVCKMPVKITANDVVDHAAIADDAEIESAIVAQKNEENAKVSALRAPSDEQQDSIPIIEKEDDNNEETDPNKATPKGPAPLKYIYKDDQWSPLNKSGKKVYDRDFLIKLQNDPNSKIKPLNLPDLEVVLKENSRNRGAMDLRQLKDVSLGGKYDFPFAPFGKQSQSMRSSVPPKRGSQQGKPKNAKPVIHLSLSLREDVKLRETENAWKPGRMKGSGATDNVEEDAKTEALYKRVRGVLNKLTPQKFNTLVNQVRALQIDSQEKLQGVIDLVFEKAVDEPSFSVAYALMCKELAMMHVSSSDSKAGKEESNVNFRKLIITRCQMEFEKNTVDETVKAVKLKEIEECTDPEKKKELQAALDEEERRIRVKSVGNIRFIGELFKQGMLTTNIMHRCIRHLLSQIDEENLECLCKLLSTIGKDLESKSQNLSDYFKQMLDIVNRKSAGKVSSRVRFMLQDVIELRLNKWVPRRDDSNPKTMAEIQKEAETERLDTHMNNTPMNTPRKDDRSNDRKRIRGSGPAEEGGWSQPVRSRQQYSVESAKLKNKPPPMDDLQLGNKNMFQWSRNVSAGAPKTVTPNKFAMLENMPSEQDKRSGIPLSGSRSTGPRDYGRPDYKSYDGRNSRNGSQQLSSRSSSRDSSLHDGSRSQSMSMAPPQPIKSIPPQAPTSTPSKPVPSMSEEQLVKKSANILEEYLSDTNINNAAIEVKETFDNSTFANFVREVLNGVVEKSATARKQVSQLMTHLISKNILPLSLYIAGLGEVLDTAEDLVIDIPKIWIYLAELIWYPLAEGVLPFSELKNTMAPLKSKGLAGKLMGELMITLVQEKSPKWIKDKWDQSGLEWSDFLQESESVNDFVKKYKLEFMLGDSISSFGSLSGQLSMEQIHERLRALMANEKENLFDNICSWISANVGERASEPQFIKILMTSILEVSIEPYNTTWKFRPDKFQNLQNLIPRYIDVNVAVLELQCLIAIQEYINKLEHPSGVLLQIIEKLWEDSIISYDAFLAWESNKDPTTLAGKSVAIMALTSFFTSLKEADDESSGDEA
ncbi:eukaryotic translation initiation factor 4 gamma 3-like isoform X2 [Diprion similis]|uniref:eukaryotic translation initiation factor 4 gamma 3-like isoform X2 n=1 Tax=Diprion similis TaxID=362088 RepID=UPI001EF93707|nr:eukaryotic translation initiation factor 4 gamma 3-like isoform X2 [Diprion similis]